MPRMFLPDYLEDLDAMQEEEAEALTREEALEAAALAGWDIPADDPETARQLLDAFFMGQPLPHVINPVSREEM